MPAQLYIIATPIGNLSDISQRALATLQKVPLILAEDTRVSRKLLSHFAISTKCQALHDYNERKTAEKIVQWLQNGQDCALISDAGTPLISDPGYYLVRQVQEAGITVVPIPGPCAAIAALSASGLATDRFFFEGFLPAKSAARQTRLQELARSPATLVFYEAPHRVVAMIEDLVAIMGEDREAVVAKELTKQYETIKRASLGQLLAWLQQNSDKVRGEFVVLVAGFAEKQKDTLSAEAITVLNILLAELPNKQAVKLAAKITGVAKNRLYEYAIRQAES